MTNFSYGLPQNVNTALFVPPAALIKNPYQMLVINSFHLAYDILQISHAIYSSILNFLILISRPSLAKEHNNNEKEDHSPVNSDISSGKSDIDLHEVFEALDSVGFRLIAYHEK